MEFFNINPNNIYEIHYPIALKYLTRLRLGLSHLRLHKYMHNFADTTSIFCSCSKGVPESTEHYLLHCPKYHRIRSELFENLRQIISLVTLISPSYTCNLLLFGNYTYDVITNRKILDLTLSFIISSKRFEGPFITK